jgi:ABC-type uncharacterized transport system YnjBCD permease subunit
VNRRLLASVAALATLSASGCAGTSVTQLWRNPDYRSRPVHRVFIFAAMPGHANPVQFENALARELAAKGFQATTASSLFPAGRMNRIQVQEYVVANKVDLFILERLTTEAADPVTVTTTVATSNGWYGSYASQTAVVAQGTDVSARVEAYDPRTEPDTLLWSGQSNVIDLQGAPQSLSAAVTSQLIEAKILVK